MEPWEGGEVVEASGREGVGGGQRNGAVMKQKICVYAEETKSK